MKGSGNPWRLNEANGLELGDRDSHGSIMDGWILPNGTYAIVDESNPGISFFDANGTLVKQVGRTGRGPGEFEDLSGGFVLNNEIWLFDPRLLRLSVWSLDGLHLRDVSLAGFKGVASTSSAIGALRDGAVILRTVELLGGTGRFRNPAHYMRLTLPDRTATLITTAPDAEQFARVVGGSTTRLTPVFWRSTSAAVFGESLILLDNATAIYRIYDGRGRLERAVDLGWEDRAVSASEVETAINDIVSAMPVRAMRRGFRSRLTQVPVPPAFPSAGHWRTGYGSFLVIDCEGNTWVRRYTIPGERLAKWFVISESGENIGQLDLDASASIADVCNGIALVVVRDEDGVNRVFVYRVVQTP